jgi:hypothetical protein
MIMGHGEEALEHSQRAVELDPFSPLFRGWYAYVLYVQRRYEEAIDAPSGKPLNPAVRAVPSSMAARQDLHSSVTQS